MNKNEIIKDLERTIAEFQQLISTFDEQQLNKVPFEGSWTPGQVAQHVSMANSGFADILNGPVKDTDRAPDQSVKKMEDILLDFTTKMQSPDFINPNMKVYNKAQLLNTLESIKSKVSKAIADLDLTQTCLTFELPGLGQLTRLEAIYFVIYHTQRHAYQLKNIINSYSAN
ncbi:MAG: DinB family protein [Candidatus Pedobacter colombiensis]|uniref:DinB family protein n=1 Tax=Candidatus Pedobacter colombiensis TaxID=3121371 RepID=A0AAJ5W9V8_9SPHI|nr:DinB family protein [Pedobacter sp.]WEK21458.1 MAG: DinB family protein [Pedobacter sp.]